MPREPTPFAERGEPNSRSQLPLELLPPGICEGSVVDLTTALNPAAERARDDAIRSLQSSICARLQVQLDVSDAQAAHG